jgi:hypothetical protein
VQVGTLFALSNDSGLLPKYREQMLDAARKGTLKVRTDHRASPTGFPFKVVELPGTVGEAGKATYTCAAEPDAAFLKKRGDEKELAGRMCLCNGLLAAVGLGQERPDGYKEAPLLTLGSTTSDVENMLKTHPQGWSAKEVVDRLLSGVPQNAKV